MTEKMFTTPEQRTALERLGWIHTNPGRLFEEWRTKDESNVIGIFDLATPDLHGGWDILAPALAVLGYPTTHAGVSREAALAKIKAELEILNEFALPGGVVPTGIALLMKRGEKRNPSPSTVQPLLSEGDTAFVEACKGSYADFDTPEGEDVRKLLAIIDRLTKEV